MINKKFWQNKKVLVTGHTGFKGSWLSLWLNSMGSNVSGIGLEPDIELSLYKQLMMENFLSSSFYVDIRNRSLLKEKIAFIQPEIIFHLAAQPLVRESYKNPLDTWEINVIGSLNILKILTELDIRCVVVMVTTDKVYKNKEWNYGYRENDTLGGYDPYSASKAASEIAISSWRSSFCNEESRKVLISSARSGNVIGGGDWSEDRIIPDAIKAMHLNQKILVRNPKSTRPWQHVLDPLAGYISLAEKLHNSFGMKGKIEKYDYCSSFNFGPGLDANRTVEELIKEVIKYWPGNQGFNHKPDSNFHEAGKLNLQVDKAYHLLNYRNKWNFENSVKRTIQWYKKVLDNSVSAYVSCMNDIDQYMDDIQN